MSEAYEEPECPGEGRCHGCLKWCSYCGDCDLMCDDPECDTHKRIEEIQRDFRYSQIEVSNAERELETARKNHQETKETLDRYKRGPIQMVPRGKRINIVRNIMES